MYLYEWVCMKLKYELCIDKYYLDESYYISAPYLGEYIQGFSANISV